MQPTLAGVFTTKAKQNKGGLRRFAKERYKKNRPGGQSFVISRGDDDNARYAPMRCGRPPKRRCEQMTRNYVPVEQERGQSAAALACFRFCEHAEVVRESKQSMASGRNPFKQMLQQRLVRVGEDPRQALTRAAWWWKSTTKKEERRRNRDADGGTRPPGSEGYGGSSGSNECAGRGCG